jgi:O-antigen ligase
MLYSFAVPWEYSLDLGEPLGNVARVLGLLLLTGTVAVVIWRWGMRMPGPMQWLVLSLYLYFAASYFWTVDPVATLEKMRAYFQVMMFVWIAWEVVASPMALRGVMRAFVAGCWVLAVLTMVNYLSAQAAAAEQIRFFAEGSDPNDVARFLDLGFPLAALLFAIEEQWYVRLIAILYVPVGLLAVLLTASRGGFSGAMAALLGSAVLLLSWRPRSASSVFTGLAVTAAALWAYVPGDSLQRLATIPQEVGGGDLNDRLGIWSAGWRAFVRAPWWGYGAGTYATAAKLAPGDTAHNTVMAVMVMGGVAGLALFLGIVMVAVAAVWRTAGLLRIALGSVLVVWGMTSMVGSVEENRVTWLLFGAMAVAGRLAAEKPYAMERLFSGVERMELASQIEAVR